MVLFRVGWDVVMVGLSRGCYSGWMGLSSYMARFLGVV